MRENSMMQNRSSIASRLCLWALAATLGACATGEDLRETSKKFEGQTESVRTSLETKIEQLKQTQRDAEKSLAKMEQSEGRVFTFAGLYVKALSAVAND